MNPKPVVSDQDVQHLAIIRQAVTDFMKDVAARFANRGGLLLDIAPQVHAGARPFFPDSIAVETLDIDPAAKATYTLDLCRVETHVGIKERFDYVVCTEVLEHTRQPFHAAEALFQLLKPGGLCFVTTPFNFRIHGPLPDCWRFTEHGLRELFGRFHFVELNSVETRDRFLMPIHYRLVVQKAIGS